MKHTTFLFFLLFPFFSTAQNELPEIFKYSFGHTEVWVDQCTVDNTVLYDGIDKFSESMGLKNNKLLLRINFEDTNCPSLKFERSEPYRASYYVGDTAVTLWFAQSVLEGRGLCYFGFSVGKVIKKE
jgi:hypothetical protein